MFKVTFYIAANMAVFFQVCLFGAVKPEVTSCTWVVWLKDEMKDLTYVYRQYKISPVVLAEE